MATEQREQGQVTPMTNTPTPTADRTRMMRMTTPMQTATALAIEMMRTAPTTTRKAKP